MTQGEDAWCSRCGCGNDVYGFARLDGCRNSRPRTTGHTEGSPKTRSPIPDRTDSPPLCSHEDVARDIILGRNSALVPQNAEHFIREITEALQDAFDLGFKAAGGTVTDLRR